MGERTAELSWQVIVCQIEFTSSERRAQQKEMRGVQYKRDGCVFPPPLKIESGRKIKQLIQHPNSS